MKIDGANPLNYYIDLHPHTKEPAALSPDSGKAHSFDELTINSDSRRIEESTFAHAVVQGLLKDVSVPAAEQKVLQIKRQVASNHYYIDSYAIAARILLVS